MSQWTQVSGSIRLDSYSFFEDKKVADENVRTHLSNRLGKIVKYDSPREDWDLPETETTPMGSEGGLEYQYIMNLDSDGEYCSINRGTILIQGSLRDYGDDVEGEYFHGNTNYTKIIDWLNRSLGGDFDPKAGYSIRQGAIEIEVQGGTLGGKHIVIYDDATRSFIEVAFHKAT